jgi:hypothetical protein
MGRMRLARPSSRRSLESFLAAKRKLTVWHDIQRLMKHAGLFVTENPGSFDRSTSRYALEFPCLLMPIELRGLARWA